MGELAGSGLSPVNACSLEAMTMGTLAGSAAGACPMSLAIYTEPSSGFELRFRVPAPWEQVGMIDHALELGLPDGRVLWGEITQNMGVSRTEGRLYAGCPKHSQDGPVPEDVLAGCLAWEGVVYALDGGTAAWVAAGAPLEPGDGGRRDRRPDREHFCAAAGE